jgi:hypothetical protein
MAKRPVLILFIFLVAYLIYRDHNLFDFLFRIIIQPYIFKFSPKSFLSTIIFLATLCFSAFNQNTMQNKT